MSSPTRLLFFLRKRGPLTFFTIFSSRREKSSREKDYDIIKAVMAKYPKAEFEVFPFRNVLAPSKTFSGLNSAELIKFLDEVVPLFFSPLGFIFFFFGSEHAVG